MSKQAECPECTPGGKYAFFTKEWGYDLEEWVWKCTNCGWEKKVGKTPVQKSFRRRDEVVKYLQDDVDSDRFEVEVEAMDWGNVVCVYARAIRWYDNSLQAFISKKGGILINDFNTSLKKAERRLRGEDALRWWRIRLEKRNY